MSQKIGCVIMASGKSVRFGRNKLIEEFQGKMLIQLILDKTEDVFARRIVVTRSEEVQRICMEQDVPVIFHGLPHRNDTVRFGVEAMKEMDGWIFCPCDQPLLRRETLQRFSSVRLGEKDIFRLASGKKIGAPILFGKGYLKELQNLPEKTGGSFLTKRYPDRVHLLQAYHEYELLDVDTPENMEEITEISEKNLDFFL